MKTQDAQTDGELSPEALDGIAGGGGTDTGAQEAGAASGTGGLGAGTAGSSGAAGSASQHHE